MDDDENFPVQCHPLVKKKKKKTESKNDSM